MFLASNLEKTKENRCFYSPTGSGDPGGTIGPTTPKKLYITNPRSTAQAAVMLRLDEFHGGAVFYSAMKTRKKIHESSAEISAAV